jgi:hypothetical protein
VEKIVQVVVDREVPVEKIVEKQVGEGLEGARAEHGARRPRVAVRLLPLLTVTYRHVP